MMDERNTLNQSRYPYPRQRVFGLFLIGVGITMALATICGTNQCPNAWIFILGYTASMVGIMFNKKIREHFAIGESTPLQKKASNFSMILIAVVTPIIGMSLSGTGNYRMIWLLILLAVGIHFIPFTVVHGKLSLLLAVLLIINSCAGLYFSHTSFVVFGIVDAGIKLLIGIILFQFSPKCNDFREVAC
jgi:hypothetical protein